MTDFVDEVARGREAAHLLEHPLLVAAFVEIRKDLMRTWAAAPVRDTEGRENIWMMTKLLERVEAALRQHIITGKMAANQLEAIKARGESNI